MSVHEQFAEDLALYALGSLEGEERTALEKHLEDCGNCRHELGLLRGDMALLALSTAGPHPPQRSRQRFIDAVAKGPRTIETRTAEKRRRLAWWVPIPWIAVAAVAIFAVRLVRQNNELRQDLAKAESDLSRQQVELQRAREIVMTLTSPDAQVVNVVETNKPPQPQGKAMYMRDRGNLIFIASNVPQPPTQKAYELWLVPVQGAPIPAGMFRPDARGSAMVINPPLPIGIEAKAFAITVEPEQGSSTPTLPIIMMGAGG